VIQYGYCDVKYNHNRTLSFRSRVCSSDNRSAMQFYKGGERISN